jgi:hypothetical protein
MFHWRRLRRLPPDIQLEVETLISDLRGERSLPLRHADEPVAEAAGDRRAELPRFARLRRFW